MATAASNQSKNAEDKGQADPAQSTAPEQTDKQTAPAATLEPCTSTPASSKVTPGQNTGQKVIDRDAGGSDSDIEVLFVKPANLSARQKRMLKVKAEQGTQVKLEPTDPTTTEPVDKGKEPKAEHVKKEEVKEEAVAGKSAGKWDGMGTTMR
eukprot:s578_g14.t1